MILQWLKSHSTAILATGIAVAKAGILGKGILSFATVLSAALANLS